MALEHRRVAIDASLAINFVIPGQPYHDPALALFRGWAYDQVTLIAPALFESEADSAIRRYVHLGQLDQDAGGAAQRLLDAVPVVIVHDARVRLRARRIAESFDQERVYDATYCALAELAQCEFWTADRAFHQAVKDGLDYVRFIGEHGT